MKIGLLRHLEVERGYPKIFVATRELMKWEEEYDASDVLVKDIDLHNIDWKKCYSSDLRRAVVTANSVFDGEVYLVKELREIKLSPVFPTFLKLPVFVHLIFIRMAWWLNHKSQSESKSEVLKKIKNFVDEVVQEGEDVLIVSHGGIMLYMRKELLRRGFQGPGFRQPENGKLFVYEQVKKG
ncbi:histidine phosphatase family protein [Rossellomorea aquimaris]|uniref:histidine phosphatase family protein n=1 Tax=Rossellomorea aquimaris TaxID=189382 RepID=UPI0007D08C4E|nr:histidine phosphatase family protein [Rossellomorea aquimaris]